MLVAQWPQVIPSTVKILSAIGSLLSFSPRAAPEGPTTPGRVARGTALRRAVFSAPAGAAALRGA
ncbi:hypothetical protein GCM10027075_73440 [Streptomyces heilongjiangensis]